MIFIVVTCGGCGGGGGDYDGKLIDGTARRLSLACRDGNDEIDGGGVLSLARSS